jgi:hypothetical protein
VPASWQSPGCRTSLKCRCVRRLSSLLSLSRRFGQRRGATRAPPQVCEMMQRAGWPARFVYTERIILANQSGKPRGVGQSPTAFLPECLRIHSRSLPFYFQSTLPARCFFSQIGRHCQNPAAVPDGRQQQPSCHPPSRQYQASKPCMWHLRADGNLLNRLSPKPTLC